MARVSRYDNSDSQYGSEGGVGAPQKNVLLVKFQNPETIQKTRPNVLDANQKEAIMVKLPQGLLRRLMMSDAAKTKERRERIQHPHHVKSKSSWNFDGGYENYDPETEKSVKRDTEA